jgi:hypothetical protein
MTTIERQSSPHRELSRLAAFLIFLMSLTGLNTLKAQVPLVSPTPGLKAICTTGSVCSAQTPSLAIIDASTLKIATGYSSTICGRISAALNLLSTMKSRGTIPTASGVVDARGVTSLSCNSGETPWSGATSAVPASILLPAAAIYMSAAWVIPNQTRLIGTGTGLGSGTINYSGCSSTTLCIETVLVAPTVSAAYTMLTMGSSTCSPCTGITIENLTLLGGNQTTISGILNNSSGQGSYINHVGMNGIEGTGLLVSGSGALNSGPYSNITFDVTSGSSTGTVCAQILNVGGTKGIHGISCLSSDTSATAGIEIDSSSNSVEDVVIQGFKYGIALGMNGTASSNSIVNVTDTTPPSQDDATIYIPNAAYPVTDLVVLGVTNLCTPSHGVPCHTFTIDDEETLTKLSAPADPYLGMYALGSSNHGYSRFTTSSSVPTWAVGTAAPQAGTTGCAAGSLFSNTGSGSPLWVCAAGTTPTWTAVPY